MTLGDRIVIMRGGRVQQVGSPMDLYNVPANRFVAGFIGSPAMNFFLGTILRDSAGPAFVEEPAGVRLRLSKETRLQNGARVMLGIRPEHLVPADAHEPDLSLGIDVVEHLGSESLLYGATPSGQVVVRVKGTTPMRRGATLHLFDRETGEAVR
jgi:lactose/L-arabinose transport system ATP-binding protein